MEVIAEVFPSVPFNQSHTQPYAVVFVWSGQSSVSGVCPGGRTPVY